MERKTYRWLQLSLLLLGYWFYFSPAVAQTLWMTGSAVPGGVQQLTATPDGGFKYTGALQAGELRLQTTKKAGRDTRYLVPLLTDASIANKGLGYKETTDAEAAAWQVPVSEDHYRFTVNPHVRVLRGEIVYPWGELFIAGGATEVGWKCEGKMLLMKQSLDNPYVWTWEGELKRHPEVEEPASFKFQGQDRWHPKALHPYRQDADILTDGMLRTGGDDTKWTLSKDGRYRITVDIFKETINAEFINN